MREHSRGKDMIFHVFFMFGLKANFQVHFANIQTYFDRNPQPTMRWSSRSQDRSTIPSHDNHIACQMLQSFIHMALNRLR